MTQSNSDIKKKVFSGLFWTTGATLINVFSQIAYTSVMARLLDPTAYGLVAMGDILLRFASYFSNMGLAQALIQKEEVTKEDIRAAFTSSIMLGISLYTLFFFLAPFSFYLFPIEGLVPVIRVMALSFLFNSFFLTSNALLRRELKFNITAKIQVFSTLTASFGVGLTLAYLNYGVWSLVLSSLSQILLNGLISYAYVRHSLILSFKWKYYRPLLGFGGKVTLNGFLTFLSYNIGTAFIGNFFGGRVLGFYSRASFLAQLPVQYLTSSISQVLFPAMSRVQNQPEKLKKAYLTSSGYLAFLIIPACTGMSLAAEPLILMFLGEKWHPSIPILQILSFAPIFNFLTIFGGAALEATNRVGLKIKITILHLISMLVCVALLARLGILGLASAIVLADLVKYLVYLYFTKKILNYSIKDWWEAHLPAFIILAYLLPSFLLLNFFMSFTDILPVISFFIFFVTGVVCLLLGFLTSPKVLVIIEIKKMIDSIFTKIGIYKIKTDLKTK
jgi:O-antigen/teichoic acid export membrane protein